MKMLRGLTLTTAIAVFSAAGVVSSGSAAVAKVYPVDVSTVPGVDTGLVLSNGQSITVTATGTACPFGGSFYCVGPDGDTSLDITLPAGFLLRDAPPWGLVGRVGNGPWVQVGSGPTTLSGSGDLVFAMNDNSYGDNTGGFMVTVSLPDSCWPGYGNGDTRHDHAGPPPLNPLGCYPGLGNGDTHHDHSGPPGHDPASPAQGNPPTNANSHSSNKKHP